MDPSEETVNALNAVSFRSDVVPIMISGACGCHVNINANGTNPKQISFAKGDTIYYGAIQSRAAILNKMARYTINPSDPQGGLHPGEGSVFFTISQAQIVKKWVEQGAVDDYTPPPITGEATYSKNIVPIVKTDCNGSACHAGIAKALDYTLLKNSESTLRKIMSSAGKSGHPGPVLSLNATCTSSFIAWMDQGFKP